MATGTPSYPFENPVHALWLTGFGLVYWWLGRKIGHAAETKGSGIFDPYGRALFLSPLFWKVYGAAGKFGQWIGLTIAGFGAVGFVFSVFNWLF